MTTTKTPTRRETYSSVRERGRLRPLVVELLGTFVRIRPKGTRSKGAYTVTYDQIWNLGAANAAAERRREKLARKAKAA